MSVVEWKSLEDLGDFYGGLSGKCKDDFQDGNAKFVTYMNVYSNLSLDLCIDDMVKVGEYEKQNSIKYGDILFTGSSETPDDCGMSCVVTKHIDEPIYLNSFCFGFRFYEVEKFEPNFLKHYFRCIAMRKAISLTASGVTRFNVSKKRFGKIQIPLLHVSKQQEIVSHLDTFTTLISNLESELDMRRKQYEHYRNQLLDFEGVEGVEWKKTKDICMNICSGGTPLTSNQGYYNGTLPWLRTQEVDWGYVYDTKIKITQEAINNSSAKMIPVNCVIIAMYGATAAKCCINKIPLSTNQACCNLEINKDMALYKYVYYWFCKEYANLKAMGEGSQNNISGNKIKGYLIPVPSLKTQQQIVEKLDAFENLIQSLEQEIKLRKQQYEYYREKLLTFEKE